MAALSEEGLEKLEMVSQELDTKKDEFFSLEARIDILENTLENLQNTKEELETELDALKFQKENTIAEGSELGQLLSDTEQSITQATEQFTSLEEERKNLKMMLSKIDTDLLAKRSESIRLHSKLQAFKEEKRTSPYKAVNTILEAKDQIKGVYGTISQLGQTEATYQTALEVAAGSRVHNIVVDTTETAKKCIQYLKQCRAGRATFLPLDRMRKRAFPAVTEEGVIDYAINLVQFDPKFRAAFEDVFSDTLVVKNLDVDIKGRRLVTLEGDVFERGGAMTGGHYFKRKYSSAFLISEDEKQFRTVQEELQSLKGRRAQVTERLSIIEPELQETYDEKIKLEERLPSLEKEMIRLRKEETDVITSIEERERKVKSVTEALKEKNADLSNNIQKKEELAPQIHALEKEKEEISKPLKKDELERIETQLESLRGSLRDTDSEKVQAQSNLQHLKEDICRIEAIVQEMLPQIETLETQIESRKTEKETIEQELQERVSDEETFDERIRNLRADRTRTRDEINELRQKKEILQQKVYKCESSLTLLENQKTQFEDSIEELRDLSSQYPVEGEYADLKELKFRIKQMEREKELLEPINMRAIEEFEEVQLRFIELKTRIDKLYVERQSILDFIAEVESQKKTVFLETFYEVAENFSRIFAELSPGGSGSLLLEDDEDPFEGGLDIEASPQGKELKRVEAMSGGEKALTALAFVFAVQQYKPAPFYFFDEIDAHLDDENLTRVAEMIKRASAGTQFIVITLRDVMMATADLLYGVSMKEGVSKIVSVELEKIAEYKEPEEAVVAV